MKKKLLFFVLILLSFLFFISPNFSMVNADELSDSLEDQLDNLDLSKLENFYDDIYNGEKISVKNFIENILSGNYEDNYTSVFNYLLKILLSDLNKLLPCFIGILSLSFFCSIIGDTKSRYLSEDVDNILRFVCIIGIFLLISTEFLYLWNTAKSTINKISELSQIITPILLTLLLATGGVVSASIYQPAVVFICGGVITIINDVIFPLIAVSITFSIIAALPSSIKLNKFNDFISSLIKWIIGITVSVFGLFLSVKGISGAIHDGITAKAAKYALSNSVPIIGGFLKDGFDLVLAGTVLIKNAVGILGVCFLIYIIVIPVLKMALFSLMLKLDASFIEVVANGHISNFLISLSKCITYMIVSVIMVGVMFFITILLIIFTGNVLI